MTIKLVGRGVEINGVHITFHRTLRLPEDGNTHSLPPSLGAFPVKKVDDYKDKVPKSWRKHGGIFIPMYQREAMWVSFAQHTPAAIKIAAGKVNAVNGKPWTTKLEQKGEQVNGKDPEQDYVIVPGQPWLDGFNIGEGLIRQFVAMPLGMGYTVEGQVTGKEKHGGLQMIIYPAKEGKFPTPQSYRGGGQYDLVGTGYSHATDGSNLTIPSFESDFGGEVYACASMGPVYSKGMSVYNNPIKSSSMRSLSRVATSSVKAAEMGLAQGGKMKQKIYEDTHGIETWDQEKGEKLFIHIVNSEMYRAITGEAAPPSPIDAHTYTAHGYPWFEIWDEDKAALQGSGTLANVKPVSEKDAEHGFKDQQNDKPLKEKKKRVKQLGKVTKTKEKVLTPNEVRDGIW